MPNNGKTYTEVLLEVYDKIDTVEQRITGKLDATIRDSSEFMSRLAAGDEKFNAQEKRIATNEADIKANEGNITKVRNLNATLAAFFSGIAAFVGWNQ